jgi:hypothetical protein
MTIQKNYNTTNSGNQRLRLNQAAKHDLYDRLITFADVFEGNVQCFIILCDTNSATNELFHNAMKENDGVGKIYFLEECQIIEQFLGDNYSLPIIKQVGRLIAIKNDYSTYCLRYEIKQPEVGETKYFSEHGINKLELVNIDLRPSICSGTFCDRQMIPSLKKKCGFFHTRAQNGLVLEMDVCIPVVSSFDMNGTIIIRKFRSLLTTKLFFKQDEWEKIEDHYDLAAKIAIRKCVRDIVNYFNVQGGWSYVGWIRTGGVQDASETTSNIGENIASSNQLPHLSVLYPTNMQLTSENNPTLKVKQYPTTAQNTTNQITNQTAQTSARMNLSRSSRSNNISTPTSPSVQPTQTSIPTHAATRTNLSNTRNQQDSD